MKHVLIVEDNTDIRGLYEDAFRRAGYEVETAYSGAEGLQKAGQQEFEIIVLDILMLELSGIDFLKGFEPVKHPTTTVVIVSNLDSQNIVQKARDLGVVNYLIKSKYTPKQLVEAIEAIVRK